MKILKYILNNNKLIRMAVGDRKYKSIKILIKDPRVDPSVDNNICLLMAVELHNDINIVKMLLTRPEVDINADNGYPLKYAIKEGNTGMIKLLKSRE